MQEGDLIEKINGIGPSGSTSFGAGLEKATSLFPQNDDKKAIIFMSDGQHNAPPDPEPYLEECRKRDIVLYTIGFGSDADEKRLRSMADKTGGVYSFSSNILNFENNMIDAFDLSAGWEKKERFSGTISNSELKNVGSFEVPPFTHAAKILLNWPGSDLDLRLINPDGDLIIDNSSDIIYSLRNIRPKYIIIKNPLRGKWAVQVYGSDVPEGRTEYTVSINELFYTGIYRSIIVFVEAIARSLLSAGVAIFMITAVLYIIKKMRRRS
jgi:hypothetical protein